MKYERMNRLERKKNRGGRICNRKLYLQETEDEDDGRQIIIIFFKKGGKIWQLAWRPKVSCHQLGGNEELEPTPEAVDPERRSASALMALTCISSADI